MKTINCLKTIRKHWTVSQKKLQTEFEDMKIESFGIQLLHLIGKIYIDKANATIHASKLLVYQKFSLRLNQDRNSQKWLFNFENRS